MLCMKRFLTFFLNYRHYSIAVADVTLAENLQKINNKNAEFRVKIVKEPESKEDHRT